MSDASRTDGRPGHGADPELLLGATVFVLLAVLTIVAATTTDAWWTTALALAGLAFAAAGLALTLARLLGSDDGVADRGRTRASAGVLALLSVAAVVLAVALPGHAATVRPAPAQAVRTVRSFLAVAVLDDDAYLACQYLAPPAQSEIARLGGPGATCREALMATEPSFDGIRSVNALDRLDLRAVVRDGRAVVTARAPGRRPVTFVLVRATPAELATFGAPQVPWRIASGATAVLHG